MPIFVAISYYALGKWVREKIVTGVENAIGFLGQVSFMVSGCVTRRVTPDLCLPRRVHHASCVTVSSSAFTLSPVSEHAVVLSLCGPVLDSISLYHSVIVIASMGWSVFSVGDVGVENA